MQISTVIDEELHEFLKFYDFTYDQASLIDEKQNKIQDEIDFEGESDIYSCNIFRISKNNLKKISEKMAEFIYWLFNESKIEIKNNLNNEYVALLMEKVKQIIFLKQNRQKHFNDLIDGKIQDSLINNNFFNETFKPFSFQEEHAMFAIKNEKSCNFSSPGSGKTIIAYMSAASLMADKKINTVVIAGPKSSKYAWKQEWEIVIKKQHINNFSLSDYDFSEDWKNKLERMNLKNSSGDELNIVFANYAKFTNPIFVDKLNLKLRGVNYLLIVDECHYIKNTIGKTFEGLIKISNHAKNTIMLSGTPVPKRASQAYYLPNFLWPDIEDYRTLTNAAFREFEVEENNPQLLSDFSKIFIRKNKDDMVKNGQLKPMEIHKIEIPKNEIEEFIDERLQNMGKNPLDDIVAANLSTAYVIRKMQAASYPLLLTMPLKKSIDELKEESLDELLEEDVVGFNNLSEIEKELENILSTSEFQKLINEYKEKNKISERWIEVEKILSEKSNERIIIWDVFRKSMKHMSNWLKVKFPNREFFLVNGEIVGEDRDKMITAFRRSKSGILVASPATIAESISLHEEVDVAIYAFRNYVASHWLQSQDRIHRLVKPGYKTNKKDIFIIGSYQSEKSIDFAIEENLKQKQQQQNTLINPKI